MRDISDLDRNQIQPNPDEGLIETAVVEIRDPDEQEMEQAADATAPDMPDVPVRKTPRPVYPEKRPAKRRKLNPVVRVLLYIIFFASLGTAIYSGFQLYVGNKERRESANAYEKLAESAGESDTVETEEGETLLYTRADFAALAEINPDIAGWLTLEGTVIDYPIVQGTDNEYYLEHLFTKEVNHSGCIFIDADNAKDFSDRNTILYAHHMRNGSMFAELEGYRDQAYYESHRSLILQTPDGLYRILPFAGMLGDGNSTYNQIEFADDAEFTAFIEQIRNVSTFTSDVEVTAADRIVTMSTCRYDVEDGRYAVFGKLVKLN